MAVEHVFMINNTSIIQVGARGDDCCTALEVVEGGGNQGYNRSIAQTQLTNAVNTLHTPQPNSLHAGGKFQRPPADTD